MRYAVVNIMNKYMGRDGPYRIGYYRHGYIDIICLVILWLIFFISLFLTQGIWFIADIILLVGTAAVPGKTIAEIVTD